MSARLSHRFLAAAWLGLPLNGQIMDDMTVFTPAAARVSCEIRTSRSEGGGKLNAIIIAAGPVSGSFKFTVRKRGSGEIISQSGEFNVESASPKEIKKASVDLDAGAAYDASLELNWPNGSSSCSSNVS
jgi:hypothetical protein